MKIKVDKLDIDNLNPVPDDLKKLSDAVQKRVVKKAVYDELVKKLMILRLLILVILLKKLTIAQKLVKLKIKYLIMIMINILLLKDLTAEIFAARLNEEKLATKDDIADFAKKNTDLIINLKIQIKKLL